MKTEKIAFVIMLGLLTIIILLYSCVVPVPISDSDGNTVESAPPPAQFIPRIRS